MLKLVARSATLPSTLPYAFRSEFVRLIFGFASGVLVATSNSASAGNFLQDIGREAGSCLHGGCDVIWSINRRLDDGLSSKIDSLAEPAKKAFEEAVDHLFKNDLDPFLSRVDSLAEQRLAQIDRIFQDAITKAETATANTIDKVRNDIILTASAEIQKIVDQILNNLECGVTFTEAAAQKFMDDNFTIFGNLRRAIGDLFNKCAPINPVDRGNAITIYLSRKCQYDIQISNMKTIGDLRNKYLEFLEDGARYLCLARTMEARAEISNYQREYAGRLDLWTLALK